MFVVSNWLNTVRIVPSLATPNIPIKVWEFATPNFRDEQPFIPTLWKGKFFYSARYLSMVEADLLDLELDLGFGIFYRDTFQLNRITCYHSNEEGSLVFPGDIWKVGKAKETVESKLSSAVDLVCQAITRKTVELWYLRDSDWVNLSDRLHSDLVTKTYVEGER